jgi:hypothetical protein
VRTERSVFLVPETEVGRVLEVDEVFRGRLRPVPWPLHHHLPAVVEPHHRRRLVLSEQVVAWKSTLHYMYTVYEKMQLEQQPGILISSDLYLILSFAFVISRVLTEPDLLESTYD